MIKYELLILIAVFSFVYTNLLTEPDQIFSGLYKWGYKFFETERRIENGKNAHWIFKIFISCEKCCAGQLALWFTLYDNWFTILIQEDYFILDKVFFSITFCILCASVIKGIYNKYIKHE